MSHSVGSVLAWAARFVLLLLAAASAEEVQIGIPELQDADVQALHLDGRVDDWRALFGSPVLNQDALFSNPYACSGHADQFEVASVDLWLAWHRATSRLYLAMERADPTARLYVNSYTGAPSDDMLNHDGSVALMFAVGEAPVQRFVAIADPAEGQHLALSQGDSRQWQLLLPWAAAGGSVVVGEPTISVVEMFVTAVDGSQDEVNATPLPMVPGLSLRIELLVPDFRTRDAQCIHLWSISGTAQSIDQDPSQFATGTLLPSGEETAVRSGSWATVKFGRDSHE